MPALVASSMARAKYRSAESSSPASRWAAPRACSIAGRYGLVGLSPWSADSASRLIASIPLRHISVWRYASVPSMVLPSGSVPVNVVRSAAVAQRSASPAFPMSAWIKAPCTAIAGYSSMCVFAGNHSIQRSTVSRRPLAQTGFMMSRTRRATRSASPACCACSIASSGKRFASYHAAARVWSSVIISGSRCCSSACSRSRNRW